MTKPVVRNRHDRRAAKAEAAPPEAAARPVIVLGSGPAEIALHLIDELEGFNPRTRFDEAELAELTADVAVRGILQPILLRPHPSDPQRYVIIAGARRFRAATAAGLLTIAALVRAMDDAGAFEAATIENLQRADMTPLEEARAFQRIIADRQAADPRLKLKDAKEVVAERVNKTVRFVELRLQLLGLPPIKQVEIEEGVTTPREAIQWLRERPKARDLDEAAALAVLEVAWALSAKKHAALYDRVTVRHDHPNDPAPGLLSFDQDYNTLTQQVALTNGAFSHLQAVTGSDLPLVRANLEAHVRRARINAIPGGNPLSSDHDPQAFLKIDQLFRDKAYLTPWLNGPFLPDPAALAKRQEARAADEARRQDWQRQEDERQAEAGRQRAERDAAETAEAARAEVILEKVQAFEADAPGLHAADFAEAFHALLVELGYTPPFAVAWDGHEVCLRDAAGLDWAGTPQLLEGLRRIMAIAINHTLGLATISGPELDETPWARKARQAVEDAADGAREAFLDKVQTILEDATDDAFEDRFPSPVSAREAAKHALSALEADEHVRFGDPDFDWSDDQAASLAQQVLDEAYGQPSGDDDGAEASEPDEDTPDYLRRLVGAAEGEAAQPEAADA